MASRNSQQQHAHRARDATALANPSSAPRMHEEIRGAHVTQAPCNRSTVPRNHRKRNLQERRSTDDTKMAERLSLRRVSLCREDVEPWAEAARVRAILEHERGPSVARILG